MRIHTLLSFLFLLVLGIGHRLTGQQTVNPAPIGGTKLLELFTLMNARLPLNLPGGEVTVKGWVQPDGSATELEVVTGAGEVLDAEALRLMKLFKAWRPVLRDGQPVAAPFRYTVKFEGREDPSYVAALNAYDFYFDVKGRQTDAPAGSKFRIVIPADNYGLPLAGDIEISTLIGNNWVIFEKGNVKYEPLDTARCDREFREANLAVFNVVINTNLFFPDLPRFEVTENRQAVRISGRGLQREWRPDGILKSATVETGEKKRRVYEWHRNGLLKLTSEQESRGKPASQGGPWFQPLERIMIAYDSTGMGIVANGNGFVKRGQLGDEEGSYYNGYKSGKWAGFDHVSNATYEEEYEEGILKKGVSSCGGKEYSYSEIFVAPKFKGGEAELYRSIGRMLKYPAEASRANIQGKVNLYMVVAPDGSLGEIKSKSMLGYGLDEAAIDALKKTSGKWQAGRIRGVPARISFTLPVRFTLESPVMPRVR